MNHWSRTMKHEITASGAARAAALAAFALAILLSGNALASGLRLSGDFVFARDTSYDLFSSEDRRGGLDLSFSYTVFYAGCAVLLDVEAGYTYFPPVEDTLFGDYPTSLLTHGAYGGLRVHLRIDRKTIEWFQPYIRLNGGWMWARAELGSGGGPAMEDWGSNGTVYAGGGIQITIPTAVFRKKGKRVCLPKQFSIGMSHEIGYLWSGPIRFHLHQNDGSDGGVDPIPIEGVGTGALDLRGMMVRVSLVVTF
jgi:hypothetical protein